MFFFQIIEIRSASFLRFLETIEANGALTIKIFLAIFKDMSRALKIDICLLFYTMLQAIICK